MSSPGMYTRAVLEDMIDRCMTEGRNLTQWERNFLESNRERLDQGWNLSEKVQEIVDRIYTEKVP